MVANHKPIGVFDSGVGGLSVLQALRQELPHEHFLVRRRLGLRALRRSLSGVRGRTCYHHYGFPRRSGCKGCRGCVQHGDRVAVESLRARFAIPIVAIEPAVKPAASRTRSRVVGVLATTGTLSSPNMGKLLANYGSDVEFVIQPCPGLADQVEKGELASDETRALVKRYVRPIIDKGGDILVLGCTHYPFLRPLIQEVAGPAVDVIDPATPVARELRRRLESCGSVERRGRDGHRAVLDDRRRRNRRTDCETTVGKDSRGDATMTRFMHAGVAAAAIALCSAQPFYSAQPFAAGPTEILWDRYGVPHIYAADRESMFYAHGWAQMRNHADLLLRLYGESRGRAAEYWGGDANLELDRWVQLNGVPERARRWYDAQDPQFRKYLDEFARGINEFAAKNPSAIGAEFRVVLPVSGVDVVQHPLRAVHYGYMGSRARMNTEVTRCSERIAARRPERGEGPPRLITTSCSGFQYLGDRSCQIGERQRDAPHQPASVLGQHVLPLHAGAPGRP